MTSDVTSRDARILVGGAAALLALGPILLAFSLSLLGMLPGIAEASTGLQTQTGTGGTVESPLPANVRQVIVQLQILTAAMIFVGVLSTAAGLSLALLFGRKASES